MSDQDKLLAEWAELLRHRDGLTRTEYSQFLARYGEKELVSVYEANWQETGLLNDFLDLFHRDVTLRIEKIEEELSTFGIMVQRPKQAVPV